MPLQTEASLNLTPCQLCKIPNKVHFTLLLNKADSTYTLPLMLDELPDLFFNIHTAYPLGECDKSNRFALINQSLRQNQIASELINLQQLDENDTHIAFLISAKH